MKTMGLALTIGLLLAGASHASEWPTMRGSVQRVGFVSVSIQPPVSPLWVRHFVNERIGTSVEPIVAEGKVFITTHNGNLYALDAETGNPLWRFQAHGAFLHSPAYDDGLVFAASTDGCLYAVSATTGKLHWSVWIGEGGFAASPAIANGIVVIGSRKGEVIAVEAATGKLRWRFKVGVPIRQTAAIANRRVFLTAEDLRVRCWDLATGKLLWVSEPLNGQSARDFYPVVAEAQGKTLVIVRTNPVYVMGEQVSRDTQFLCQQAGIEPSWKTIEAWVRSEKAKGDPSLWEKEQQAIIRYLHQNPDNQTFFVLDATTGKLLPPAPILWAMGCQGVGMPPVVLPDGRLLVFYRSVYGNWTYGVAPLVALGLLDLTTQRITPLFHRHGMQPPWNTFWGTADESQHFLVANDTVLIIHQATLSGFNLRTGELFLLWGDRDSWGGFRNLPWARNEWNGPGRGSVVVVNTPKGVRLYWQTGSRLLCLAAGEKKQPTDVGIDGSAVPMILAPRLPTPTRDQLAKRLEEAVMELLSQRWAPLLLVPGLAGYEFAFAHSGELFEALAWAYPHLSADLQKQVKAFLALQWQNHPPFTTAMRYPLNVGEPREWWLVPPGLRNRPYFPPHSVLLPHPFGNLYAVWLYAERCGEKERVRKEWQAIRRSFEEFAQSGWRLDPERGDLWANRYLASLLAFQRLAQQFGDEQAAQQAKEQAEAVQQALLAWWRRVAQQATLRVIRDIGEWDTFISQGDELFFRIVPHKHKIALFHSITPEVADFIRSQAPEEVQKVWSVFSALCATWHLVGEERQVHYGENLFDPPDFSESAFRAFAWLRQASVDELVRRIDLPICRADVSYVLKLSVALSSETIAKRQ